jgi:hypothetical protein
MVLLATGHIQLSIRDLDGINPLSHDSFDWGFGVGQIGKRRLHGDLFNLAIPDPQAIKCLCYVCMVVILDRGRVRDLLFRVESDVLSFFIIISGKKIISQGNPLIVRPSYDH